MDGADAVMLSGETSVGNYPVQVIEKMTGILGTVENSSLIKVPMDPPNIRTNRYITKSVCYHAAIMANEIKAKAISTLTNSGYTAFQISAWRPSAHILVFTSNKRILTQLNLLWGVQAFYYDRFVSTDETIDDVNKMACEKGLLEVGDMLISLAAMPIKNKGMVNTLRVTEIDANNF
jgi:pyruvate kinase